MAESGEERHDGLYALAREVAGVVNDPELEEDHLRVLYLEGKYGEHGMSHESAKQLYRTAKAIDDVTPDAVYDAFMDEYFEGDVDERVEQDELSEYMQAMRDAF